MSKQLSKVVAGRPPTGTTGEMPPRRRPIAGDENASEAVVAAVANATDTDRRSLPPLSDYVDADSLNRLVGVAERSPSAGLVFTRAEDIPTEVEVSFEYAGHEVTVSERYVVVE
ncbi:HalOD1 output domain-containing protein [Halorussus caseinilyticus]|uniref:HalOD1 output domain-containing protein n=1 Tax=Halorussus caseinilyticus TaxID=3034025 RepID=A0ABD5WHC7_9EURY|nr:HalOD1 output domain-containing protein [Halorussus sp. DT72]